MKPVVRPNGNNLPKKDELNAEERANAAGRNLAVGGFGALGAGLFGQLLDRDRYLPDEITDILRKDAWNRTMPGVDDQYLHEGDRGQHSYLKKSPREWVPSSSRASRRAIPRIDRNKPIEPIDRQRVSQSIQDPSPASFYLRNKLDVSAFGKELGQDLGGFSRSWRSNTPDPMARVLTVTPGVNSSRFAYRLLPRTVDEVYRAAKSYGIDSVDGVLPVSVPQPGKKGFAENWGKKIRFMDSMAKQQSLGDSVSGTLWGTLWNEPRYEYAQIRHGAIETKNPEVHIMNVAVPPKLETKYKYTDQTRSPWQLVGDSGQKSLGPHWGAVMGDGNPVTGIRKKSDTVGDIHFRSDLIKRRGSLSFADVQALQLHHGLPVTPSARDGGFRTAVESLRSHLNLDSHADVIERFARKMPTLGRTTAPRQPAPWVSIKAPPISDPDLRISIPEGVRRLDDIGAALQRQNLPATVGGLETVRRHALQMASRGVNQITRMAGQLPGLGAVGGALLDPEAALILGQAISAPTERKQLIRGVEALGTLGFNTGMGAAIGTAVQRGARGLARVAPRVAARVLPPLAAGAQASTPAGLMVTGAHVADALVTGITGKPTAVHAAGAFRRSPVGRATRHAVGGRSAEEALPELFPAPRSVPARTPSGVARLTAGPKPQDPVRKAGNELMYMINQARQGRVPYTRR